MRKKLALQQFFDSLDITDIHAPVDGELNEHATDDFSYFYGNGELIICDNKDDSELTLFVDDYGDGNLKLSE